jgi:hypothetical protein
MDMASDMLRLTSDSRAAMGLQASDVSARDTQRNEERELFAAAMNRAKRDGARTPEQDAREAAEGLVSAAFLQPLLKRFRESSQAAPPFGPGRGEQTMRTMLDQSWADQMVRHGNWPLVDSVEERMLQRLGKDAQLAKGPQVTSLGPATPAQPIVTNVHAATQAVSTRLPAAERAVTDLTKQRPTVVTNLRKAE